MEEVDCYAHFAGCCVLTEEGASKGKKKKSAGSKLVAKAYYGDFTKRDLGVLLDEATNGKLTFRKVDEPVEVYRRSSGKASSSSSSSPSPKPPPSTTTEPPRVSSRHY